MPSKGAIGVAVEIEGMLLKNGWILSETLVNPCPSIAALIDDRFKPAKEALEFYARGKHPRGIGKFADTALKCWEE